MEPSLVDRNAVKIHAGLSQTFTTDLTSVTECRPCSHHGSPKTQPTQKQVTKYPEGMLPNLLLNRHLLNQRPLSHHPFSQETMLFLDFRLMNDAYHKWMRYLCSTSAIMNFPLRHPVLVVLSVDLDGLQ